MAKRKIIAFAAGVGTSIFSPIDWFLYVFGTAIGVSLLIGVLCSAAAKEPRPMPFGLQSLSFLILGTTRPTAIVPSDAFLQAFFMSAAYVFGLGAGMLLLGIWGS